MSTLELQARVRLPEYQHLIRTLERSGDLNRALEFLPADDELAERRKLGVGITRPELSILLAYSKIWLTIICSPRMCRRIRTCYGADPLLSGAAAGALRACYRPASAAT